MAALVNSDLWNNTTGQVCRRQILSQFRQLEIATDPQAKGGVAMQTMLW